MNSPAIVGEEDFTLLALEDTDTDTTTAFAEFAEPEVQGVVEENPNDLLIADHIAHKWLHERQGYFGQPMPLRKLMTIEREIEKNHVIGYLIFSSFTSLRIKTNNPAYNEKMAALVQNQVNKVINKEYEFAY